MSLFFRHKSRGNNHFTAIIIILAVCAFFPLSPQAAWAAHSENNLRKMEPISVEYMEDKAGILNIEQVQTAELSRSFRSNGSSFLALGNSRSTWWIRLKGGYSAAANKELFLSINNASVQNVILWIPIIDNGARSYLVKKAGWQYKEGLGDEGFLYPVFKLPDNIDGSRSMYIRVQSVYAHSYRIHVLTRAEFNALRQRNLFFVALLLGVLLTMSLLNFVIYVYLGDKTYLYYVIYIVSMLIFQAVLLGVPRIFAGKLSGALIMNTCAISCIVMMTSISFIRSFLDTSENVPKHDFVLKILAAVSFLIIIPMFIGWRFEANFASNFLAYAVAITIMSAAIISIRKGVRQAKYFLIAWAMLIIGDCVFVLRSWGVLANSFLAQHFLLLAAVTEALLISIALVDRVWMLQKEKEKATKLLMQANEGKRTAEMAFLQAQIKPHFLYNSLSVIASLCIKDPPRAKELLYNLSDYLRGSFNFESINGTTMLYEELATVRAYLAIEKERFRDKLSVSYDIDETVKISIPLLTIQPLVENALRHGIFKKPDGGSVEISVKNLEDFVVIRVHDDGVGIPESKLAEILEDGTKSSGTGLKNINKRLLLHYGQGLELESREGFGTSVTVRIPRIPGGESNAESNNS